MLVDFRVVEKGGKIDVTFFEMLMIQLNDYVKDSNVSYSMTWSS